MNGARIVIAGVSSGTGKTSISTGLSRAFVSQGLNVQTYKVGPDYLDPQLLCQASGRTCFNLDSWMTDQAYISALFKKTSRDADVSVVEGVMGLFDGADPTTISGSTAEIAQILVAPVILVVNTHGMGGSFAALVKGYAEFHPEVTIAGVIANQCGSPRHVTILTEALAAAGLPPLLGAIPRNALPRIPDRHLGLVTPEQDGFPHNMFAELADAITKHVDLDAVMAVAQSAGASAADCREPRCESIGPLVRIGIARDKAFSFYYPDNLQLLEEGGAVLVPFSPLADGDLPPDLDALYIGGGYPEEYAEQLSANEAMLKSVRNFADSGSPVYAECGGLMYLSESLTSRGGDSFAMVGILPSSTVMLSRLRTLGYAEVTLDHDSIMGPKGTVLRGHEFHYSDLQPSARMNDGWNTPYRVRRRSGQESAQGFLKGNILASYVHLHFGSNPNATDSFVKHIKQEQQ
ncbi:MAG: cobyrinate a,c-diamide synthase [Lentisphaerae bacterium]|nr:cobyrinate a,c-diamide synthase [Lentisphaerota bacterium]